MFIIDQAQGQDGWILAKFSVGIFMDQTSFKGFILYINFKGCHENSETYLP